MSRSGSSAASHVKVVVRTKPTAKFAHEHIELDREGKSVNIHVGKNADQMRGYINNKQQGWSFPVDAVLHDASQEAVYESCSSDLVAHLMRGFSGTVLAYGETGAGKTHTMCGPPRNFQLRGIIPRAIAQVFTEVKECKEYSYRVYISYLEIYNEVIFDLLASLPSENDTTSTQSPLTIAEDDRRGVYVKGLTCREANSEEEALNMLFEGETNRTTAAHALNKWSSRSHCVFTITVEARAHSQSSAEYSVSRLNLVDLAGSERLNKTQPSGATEKEAMYINRSLSFLEQVIIARSDSSRDHIPYRQSKLTHLLRESLGGNSYTVLISNVWAELEQLSETLSTLRFASRVRRLRTNPVKNTLKDPQLLLKEYEKEIQSLKEELAMRDTLRNRVSVSYDALSEPEREEIRLQVDSFLSGTLTDIELVSVRQVKEVFAQFKALALCGGSYEPVTEGLQRAVSKTTVTSQSTSKAGKESKEPVQTVGQTEGIGLGLGEAAVSLKHPASPAAALKKCKAATKADSKHRDGKASTKGVESPAGSVVADEEGAPSEVGSHVTSHVTRPDTPPSKAEVFEEFKRQRGSEINKVFLDNKSTCHLKKKEATKLSISINSVKKKIDELMQQLSDCREEYCKEEKCESGVCGEEAGDVMEEWQFNTLRQLKELKMNYRDQYKCLQGVLQEMAYCSQYVTQSRNKLVEEFENWYRAAFLGDCDEDSKIEAVQVEGKGDEFDTLQACVLQDPSTAFSSAFYTAQLRTEKRGYQLQTSTGKAASGHVSRKKKD